MANQTPGRIAYRFLSGRPLDGEPRTDATYLHPATRALTPSGRASRWARLPGWKRQAARLAPPMALAGAALEPAYTATAAALLAGLAVTQGRKLLARRRFHAAYLGPTIAAIRPALGEVRLRLHVSPELGSLTPRLAKPISPAEEAARQWYGSHVEPVLRWVPDRAMRGVWAVQAVLRPLSAKFDRFRRPADEVRPPRIEVVVETPYLTAEDRKFVSAVISSKIPVGDLKEAWDMIGSYVTGTWTVRRRPPVRVGLDEIRDAITRAAEDEFVLGLGTAGGPVVISLGDDSPHIAISAGSGAGKSVLAQLIAAQVLSRGGTVFILDRKGSHKWAIGMAGVTYCRKPEQMHEALVALGKLADLRNEDAFDKPDGWDPGDRVLVICEELNATFAQLGDYWAEVRESGDPKLSPAIRGLREILFMGRSAKVNVVAIAQLLTARAIGGPESRENFGVRCLARYTSNAWKMLVPEAAMPRASRTLGRWQVVVGGVATETQVAYLTAAQVRALAGVPERAKVSDSPLTSNVPGDARSIGDIADPLAELVTLRQAVDAGIVPGSFDAAKKRLQRAKRDAPLSAPAPAGKRGLADTYRVGDLVAWTETAAVS